MNLLKSLQQTQTQRAAQPLPGQAANLREMLAAKTGKAGTTSGPAISSVQEKQALADFSQQATAQQKAGQAQADQQSLQQQQQQQQFSQGQQRLSAQKARQQQQFDQGVEKVANNLARFKDDLKSKEGQQALNEALFARKLADDKYITDLTRAGQERRLIDAQNFELEAGKAAFANWEELFQNQQAFATAMEMDQAEFEKNLARMDISTAEAILQNSISAANEQAQIEAWGGLGSAFIQGTATAANLGLFNSSDTGSTFTPLTTPTEEAAKMSLPSSQRGTFLDTKTSPNQTSQNWWDN